MAPEQFGADGVKRAQPRHAFSDSPDEMADALFHFTRGFIGEGDSENFIRPRPPRGNQVRDARCQHLGFTGACPCKHQNRTIERFDSTFLLGI